MYLEPKNKKKTTLPTRALLLSSFVYCYLPKSKQHKAFGWVRAYSGAPRTACTVCWVQCADFWLLWQTAKILLAFQCQKVGYLEVKRARVLIRKWKKSSTDTVRRMTNLALQPLQLLWELWGRRKVMPEKDNAENKEGRTGTVLIRSSWIPVHWKH